MRYFEYIRKFAGALISNIATLALSFVLAVIVWSAANRANDPITTRIFELPITQQGLLPSDGNVTVDGDTVRLTVEGPASIAGSLLASDFSAVIDLSTLPFGESEAAVQVFPLNPTLNLEIVAQDPSIVLVNTIPIISEEIPVEVSIVGEAARGYERGDIVLDPETIFVTGPENEVSRLKSARITLFLESPREDFIAVRALTWLGQDQRPIPLGNIETSTNEVAVSIAVNQTEGVKVVPIIANWIGTPPNGYRLLAIEVDPESALVSGAPAILDGVQSIETETIDIFGATESFEQRVTLNLPKGIVLGELQSVVARFDIEPIVTSDVIRKKVEIRALGAGYTATLQTEEVTVFIFGPLPVLNSVTLDDVSVTLDLLDLGPGIYNIQPIVNVTAADIVPRSTQPEFVTVEIQSLADLEELSGNLIDESEPQPGEPDDVDNKDIYPEPEN
jgi:YbbR domain-containing protein